jgi:hypothetical protein
MKGKEERQRVKAQGLAAGKAYLGEPSHPRMEVSTASVAKARISRL